jgi:hypothetical protein
MLAAVRTDIYRYTSDIQNIQLFLLLTLEGKFMLNERLYNGQNMQLKWEKQNREQNLLVKTIPWNGNLRDWYEYETQM